MATTKPTSRKNEYISQLGTIVDGLKAQLSLAQKEEKDALNEANSERIAASKKKVEEVSKQLKEYKDLLAQNEEQVHLQVSNSSDRLLHEPIYYADYLQLGKVLSAQLPESAKSGKEAHDEMLFIIIHQAYELWFKQILHELDAVVALLNREYVPEKDISRVVHLLGRVVEIQKVLVHQFDILETMSSLDFMDFRDFLFPASGFQSFQFRLVENKLGIRPEKRAMYNRKAYHTTLSEEHQKLVQKAETEPSLFEVVERWLERTPFLDLEDFKFLDEYKKAVEAMFNADREVIISNTQEGSPEREKELSKLDETEKSFQALFDEKLHNEQIENGTKRFSFRATQAALLIYIYQEQPLFALPFRLLNSLVDIDEYFTSWRYRHALMVHRMLGSKIGTGGSGGYWYLKSTVERGRVFTDIGNLSSYLISRKDLPPLPPQMVEKVNFYFSVTAQPEKMWKSEDA